MKFAQFVVFAAAVNTVTLVVPALANAEDGKSTSGAACTLQEGVEFSRTASLGTRYTGFTNGGVTCPIMRDETESDLAAVRLVYNNDFVSTEDITCTVAMLSTSGNLYDSETLHLPGNVFGRNTASFSRVNGGSSRLYGQLSCLLDRMDSVVSYSWIEN